MQLGLIPSNDSIFQGNRALVHGMTATKLRQLDGTTQENLLRGQGLDAK